MKLTCAEVRFLPAALIWFPIVIILFFNSHSYCFSSCMRWVMRTSFFLMLIYFLKLIAILCSKDGYSKLWIFMQQLVIFLKMFIQMIFSGSQSIKMMPAYSSVLSLYFQDLRWPKMISIYSAIFDWGPSSRLGVQGQFPLLIS